MLKYFPKIFDMIKVFDMTKVYKQYMLVGNCIG